MTAPTIEQLPVRVPGAATPPSLIHSSCKICSDPALAFCGHKYNSTLSMSEADRTPTTCVVCAELEEVHDWFACVGWRP